MIHAKANVEEVTLPRWTDFIDLVQKEFSAPCWLFRGQCDARWGLQSLFERAYRTIDPELWAPLERYSMEAFRRRFHLFDSNPPSDDDALEWLALMQHHGAPTRLLDWTRSPYVAAYFALDGDFGEAPAVWLINVLIL